MGHKAIQQKSVATSSPSLQHTRWIFFALCCYVASQGFTIPILAVGPSWALWLTLSDLAAGLLVLTFLLSFRQALPASSANKSVGLILIFVLLGSILSFLSYVSWVVDEDAAGINVGVYQIYRLVEFISIFWVTTRIPLAPERLNVLRWIVDIVLVFVCAGVVLTYVSILPLSALTAHLPQSLDVAGPWSFYANYDRLDIGGQGWGTISYHHAYVAAQVLMLVSLRIHLSSNQEGVSNNVFLLMSTFTCLISDSRAGLAAMLIFAIKYWSKKPIYVVVITAVAIAVVVTASVITLVNSASNSGSLIPGLESTLERQQTLFDPSNPENLSGRVGIWVDRITYLNEEPIRWFVGGGFGATIDSNGLMGAHLLFLHIITETGLVGLLIFVFLFYKILYYLYQYESGERPIFWVTTAFLASSLTQETFYPVPALGHFLGFYLCTIAIVMRK